MKKLLFIAAAALLLAGCGNKGYTVEGNVEGLTGKVKLMNGQDIVAETDSQEGHFTFKGNLETPAIYTLTSEQGRLSLLFLESGTTLKVSGIIDGADTEIRVTGSKAHDNMRKYNEWESKVYDRYRDAAETEREAIIKERDEYITNTITENTNNLFGVYMLRVNSHSMEPEDALAMTDKFPAAYQNMEMVTYVRGNAEAKLRTAEGKHFIDVTLPDAGGNDISLSSVVGPGKYVLLDFWASWCGPCMKELPHLLEAYGKYHGKGFEIYGVSLDRDRDAWVNCIRDNKMEWYHVSAVKFWDCPAAKLYGVNSIPAFYLINPEGTIIARNFDGKELLEKLAELLD